MSDVEFQCPHCKATLDGEEGDAGTKIFCPSCGKSITVPNSDKDEITFFCWNCGKELAADNDMAGQTIDCPSCNHAVQIPAVSTKTKPHLKESSSSSGNKTPPPSHPPNSGSVDVECYNCRKIITFSGGQYQQALHVYTPYQCPYCNTRISIPGSPPEPTSDTGRANCLHILVFMLIGSICVYLVWVKSAESPASSRTGSAYIATNSERVDSRSQAVPAPDPQSKSPFNLDIKVAAMTTGAWPTHSITFELYVNGTKVGSMDSTDTGVTFPSVSVKEGDKLFGRALWRNGYGAVGMVWESLNEIKNEHWLDQVASEGIYRKMSASETRKNMERAAGHQFADIIVNTYQYPDLERRKYQ